MRPTCCRRLSKTAIEPELIEELRAWAVELVEEAEQTKWSTAHHEERVVSSG
jgi:hypothetical protein